MKLKFFVGLTLLLSLSLASAAELIRCEGLWDNVTPYTWHKVHRIGFSVYDMHFIKKGGGAHAVKHARVEKSAFPYPEFIGEKIVSNDRQFRLIDIGSVNEIQEHKFIEEAMLKAEPWVNLELEPSQGARAAIPLSSVRRKIYQKVVDVYLQAGLKSYLSENERDILSILALSDNMFVLADTTGLTDKESLKIPNAEIIDRAVLTISLARFQDHKLWVPTGMSFLGKHGNLPHLVRSSRAYQKLAKTKYPSQQMDSRLDAYIGGREAGEFTRYVKFDKTLSPEAHAYVLLKVLELAKKSLMPVDVLIMSVDNKTRRLFERFGFEFVPGVSEFMPKKVDEATGEVLEYDTEEVRLFLDVHGPKFEKTRQMLIQQSAGITVKNLFNLSPPEN